MPKKPQDRLHKAALQMLSVSKEEEEEEQEWSPSGARSVPTERLHIKEEQEELWSSQEGGDIIKFTLIKSEDEEERPQPSQSHRIKTEADEEDCGGPEPQGNTDDDTSDVSEPGREVIGGRRRSPPPSGLSFLQNKSGCSAGDVSFSCFDCGKLFSKTSNLKRHMRIHTGEKPFSCLFCGASFARGEILRQHMRIHTGDKPFCCSVCGKAFIQKVQLTRHTALHTGARRHGWSAAGQEVTCRFQLKNDECVIDPRGTENLKTEAGEEELNPQSQPGAADDNSSDVPESETDDSDDWRKSRRPSGSEQRERSAGEQPFRCSDCGKQFSQKGNLKRHVRIHTGEKPFSCSVCSRSFVQKVQLTHHMVRHTGEKRYRCSLCGKSFTWLYQLQKHQRAARQAEQQRRRRRTEEDGGSECLGEERGGSGAQRHRCPHGELHAATTDRKSGQDQEVAASDPQCNPGNTSDGAAVFSQRGQQRSRVPTERKASRRSLCRKTSPHAEGDVVHRGDKGFGCSVCSSPFKHGSRLTAHLRAHGRRKRSRGSLCPKQSS